MSKQPEDKATLRKQLDELRKSLEDFESDITLDEAARTQISKAAWETVEKLERQLTEIPD
jgi:hypothetical protein